MRNLPLGAALFATFSIVALASAHAQAPTISIEHAWARATVAAVRTGAAYVTIIDHGAPDRLIAVSTPVSDETQVHETIHDGNVMKMRPVEALAIPSEVPVTLAPGGYHIMLMKLKQPLMAGQTFPLSLRFQNAGTVETVVTVQAVGGDMPMTMPGMTKP